MKKGVLGGTFDPIHNGHLALAEEVGLRFSLDEVIFVPAGQPWLRMDNPLSAAAHRVQMVRLAIAGEPHYKLSTTEVERAGPSYTVDTIAELSTQLDKGDQLFFILGWDNLSELPRWHEPSRLVKICSLVAVPRPGYPPPDLEVLAAAIPGLARSVTLLEAPYVDISASEIRRRVSRGLSINHLVPGPVADYIQEHGLYTSQG
jgi:nicotinate-nucleotide adenylyltransferase